MILVMSVGCLNSGEVPKGEDLLVKEDVIKLKRCIYSSQVFLFNALY